MIEEFLHLFRGNPGVMGEDSALGPDLPGPVRVEPDQQEQWRVMAEAHIEGSAGIGVYPYNHEHEGVAWGCVDLDEGEHESWAHAINVRAALHAAAVPAWIERSRSKGYHVWVFSSGWVPAADMRRLLVGACEAASAPSREVNPKSAALASGQLGNYVRLPYKGVRRADVVPSIRNQVVVDLMGTPLSLRLFLVDALAEAPDARALSWAANTFHEPLRRPERPVEAREAGRWQEDLSPLAKVQLEQGPRGTEGGRSAYLWAFGVACAESGLAHDEIVAAVRLADRMHCRKYQYRRDADARYDDIARKAIDTVEESSDA